MFVIAVIILNFKWKNYTIQRKHRVDQSKLLGDRGVTPPPPKMRIIVEGCIQFFRSYWEKGALAILSPELRVHVESITIVSQISIYYL